MMRIDPGADGWEASMLPLYYVAPTLKIFDLKADKKTILLIHVVNNFVAEMPSDHC